MPMEPSRRGAQAERTVLPNGLRIITERLDHVDSVTVGLWVTAGSQDDPPGFDGMSHLLEHMLFKGTAARSTLEIGRAIDDIGGHVNGFTDRELIHLHAQTVAEHTQAALELLFDLLLRSICAEPDLEREKQVVLQEIAHLEDVPEGWVHELLPQTVWAGHALARPPLGTRESVASIARDALLGRLADFGAADGLLVAAAGRLDHERVVDIASRAGEDLSPRGHKPEHNPPGFRPERRLISRPARQVHFCLATPGCSQRDEARHAFAVLDVILGSGNSSRLFQEIRENRGLAYSIGSYLQAYRNAGLFVISAGVAKENFQLVLDLIESELLRLREQGPSEDEVARAKTQLKVAIALAAESTSFRMQHLAGSEVCWGRTLSLGEIIAGVERVTAEDVGELARLAFAGDRQALVAVGPFTD
ncbi:MAG: insulinase family protein [Armatimonadota bacterium]|nr:MAG: insulinase family protein [Armatimonadota bacterium]